MDLMAVSANLLVRARQFRESFTGVDPNAHSTPSLVDFFEVDINPGCLIPPARSTVQVLRVSQGMPPS